MKKLCILGSTGSIGVNTLRVVKAHPQQYEVFALSCHSNLSLLQQQVQVFSPKVLCVSDVQKFPTLKKMFPHLELFSGEEGLLRLVSMSESEVIVNALVGFCGIAPTLQALKLGKHVAIANKEVLVAAGELVMQLAGEKGAKLLPIDSEHSAIFQCLNGENPSEVSRLILTASGGPFRSFKPEELKKVTLEQALKHPNWSMGAKISVDSSTLMNKGLEVIEAYFLFGVPLSRIEVVVHPQSLIHSMVEFVDHSLIAQWSTPCMTLPIQYALSYPQRLASKTLQPFDFTREVSLNFMPPDDEKFPCLALARASLREGGSSPCFLNAANEVLVDRFLRKDIHWYEIAEKLCSLVEGHHSRSLEALDEVIQVDREARQAAQQV